MEVKNMSCPPHNKGCFSETEKNILKDKGWTEEQIRYVQCSAVEDKIKELIKTE